MNNLRDQIRAAIGESDDAPFVPDKYIDRFSDIAAQICEQAAEGQERGVDREKLNSYIEFEYGIADAAEQEAGRGHETWEAEAHGKCIALGELQDRLKAGDFDSPATKSTGADGVSEVVAAFKSLEEHDQWRLITGLGSVALCDFGPYQELREAITRLEAQCPAKK